MKKLIFILFLLTSCAQKYYYFPNTQIYNGKEEKIIQKYPETKAYFEKDDMQKVKWDRTWRGYKRFLIETKNQYPL